MDGVDDARMSWREDMPDGSGDAEHRRTGPELKDQPPAVRRDVTRAVARGQPVDDLRNAELAVSAASEQRRQLRRQMWFAPLYAAPAAAIGWELRHRSSQSAKSPRELRKRQDGLGNARNLFSQVSRQIWGLAHMGEGP